MDTVPTAPADSGANSISSGASAGSGSSADPGIARRAAGQFRRTFTSLRVRNFRLFATGQVISNSGTWMQRVAQDWLVLDLTHSGTAVGIATGLQFLPLLLFSLWGGMIADRYPKRRVLMVTQGTAGALALILGVLAVTNLVRVWQVYLLAFGLGMATVVDNPTRQSFVIEMVGRGDLRNAIALNSAVFNLARIVGPAIAGLVIGLFGTPVAFLLNAASYVAVIVSLSLMRESDLHAAERVARARGQLREGLRYVRSRPDLLMTMVLVFFIATFGMNFQVTTALMSRLVFHTGAGKFGLASAVFALGALIGALVAARRNGTGMRLLVGTGLAFSLLEVVTGLMPTYWMFLILLVPTGLAVINFTTTANSSVQLGTAAEMRGRVMGIYMFVFLGGAPAGAPLTGLIAQHFGTRIAIAGGGVISIASAIVVAVLIARYRGVPMRRYLRETALARVVALRSPRLVAMTGAIVRGDCPSA